MSLPYLDEPCDRLAAVIAVTLGDVADSALAPYLRNRLAHANNALQATFPTLAALLGAEGMRALSARFLHQHPPSQADWAEWGAQLPDWIARQESLAEWPYLADCARLDWACCQLERAADSCASGDGAPPLLRLLASSYAIVEIWLAHHGRDGRADEWFAKSQALMGVGAMQHVAVVRFRWRAIPTAVRSEDWHALAAAGARSDA